MCTNTFLATAYSTEMDLMNPVKFSFFFFTSGSGGGLGTGGLALACQCQQSGRVRACVESVLVLPLMTKLRPLVEAEGLITAFTEVASWKRVWKCIFVVLIAPPAYFHPYICFFF